MGQATRGSSRKQGYQRIVQGSTRMNGTGSGLSIHLQDEDTRKRTLPEAEGTLRMRVKGKRILRECSGNVQDEHRDDPSGIVVGRTPPSFRGREVRGPSYF